MCIRDRTKEARSECFFGMGCNFIGLGDLDKAEESFEKYLAVSPDGEYRDDVDVYKRQPCMSVITVPSGADWHETRSFT